jgi:LysM repeat protein
VERSPRTARWSPCLACEGGWKAARPGNAASDAQKEDARESDFVLGDEDEDDDQDEASTTERILPSSVEPGAESVLDSPSVTSPALVRHIVKKSDTLIGIALKYGLDVSISLPKWGFDF